MKLSLKHCEAKTILEIIQGQIDCEVAASRDYPQSKEMFLDLVRDWKNIRRKLKAMLRKENDNRRKKIS